MTTLTETAFDRFLAVANNKDIAQRLLLVFAKKEVREDEGFAGLPPEAQDFSVKPIMYIDKATIELRDFNDLLADSLKNGELWNLLYVTAVDDRKFSPEQLNQRLEFMVKLIHQGEAERFLIFNNTGELAHLAQVTVQ